MIWLAPYGDGCWKLQPTHARHSGRLPICLSSKTIMHNQHRRLKSALPTHLRAVLCLWSATNRTGALHTVSPIRCCDLLLCATLGHVAGCRGGRIHICRCGWDASSGLHRARRVIPSVIAVWTGRISSVPVLGAQIATGQRCRGVGRWGFLGETWPAFKMKTKCVIGWQHSGV